MSKKSVEKTVEETIQTFKSGKLKNRYRYGMTYRDGSFYTMVRGGEHKKITEERARDTIRVVEQALL